MSVSTLRPHLTGYLAATELLVDAQASNARIALSRATAEDRVPSVEDLLFVTSAVLLLVQKCPDEVEDPPGLPLAWVRSVGRFFNAAAAEYTDWESERAPVVALPMSRLPASR